MIYDMIYGYIYTYREHMIMCLDYIIKIHTF